jgi:hypothetical protein
MAEGTKMILGEALALRADLKKRLAELKNRITANAGVQEGEAGHDRRICQRQR